MRDRDDDFRHRDLVVQRQIAGLYTRDPPVRELAARLLLMAALFQFSDGVQVGAAGALRGFKDTTIPMALCIFSYWVVGFTFAYMFGVYRVADRCRCGSG